MRRLLLAAALVAGLALEAAAQPASGPWSRVIFGSSAGPIITSGAGSPEGVISAPGGSLYLQSDGAAGVTLWIKTGAGASGWSTPGGGGGGGPHALLSSTHSDTAPAAANRGALVVGNSTPAWSRLTIGASGSMLRSNGTDPAWSTDGSALVGLNASAVTTGTLDAARLPASVSLFGPTVDTAELADGAVTFAKWAPNGCTVGQVAKYSGSAWACAGDDTTAGGGTTHSILSATHTDTIPASLVAGDLLAANGSAALARVPVGTAGQVLTVTAGAPAWATPAAGGSSSTRAIGLTIDGAGSAITTGVKGFVRVPYSGTITRSTLLSTDAAATPCSIVLDVWKDVYASYPPTVADTITASAKPTLASANKATDATLTGWAATVTAGDIVGWKVDSVTGCTRVVHTLEVTP